MLHSSLMKSEAKVDWMGLGVYVVEGVCVFVSVSVPVSFGWMGVLLFSTMFGLFPLYNEVRPERKRVAGGRLRPGMARHRKGLY